MSNIGQFREPPAAANLQWEWGALVHSGAIALTKRGTLGAVTAGSALVPANYQVLLTASIVLFQLVIGEHDVAAHDEFEQIRRIKKVIIEPDFSTRLVDTHRPAWATVFSLQIHLYLFNSPSQF